MKCFWDDTWVTEKGLSAAEVLVLSKLLCFSIASKGAVATTTYKHLCLTCGVSTKTLQRMLPKFNLLGYIRQQIARKGVIAYEFTMEETVKAEPSGQNVRTENKLIGQNVPSGQNVRITTEPSGQNVQVSGQNVQISGQNVRTENKILNNNINIIERVKNAPAHEENFLISGHVFPEIPFESELIYTKRCMCKFGYLFPQRYVTKFLAFVAEKESEGRRFADKTKSFERFMSKEINFGGRPTIGETERLWLDTLLDVLEQSRVVRFCNHLQDIRYRNKQMYLYFTKDDATEIGDWFRKQNLDSNPQLQAYNIQFAVLAIDS